MRPDTMTHSPRPRRRSKTDRLDPHTRLGLTPQASAEDLERAHRELVSLLQGAPESMRRWAQQEIGGAPQAGGEDLERAHRELVSLLEGAPESMRRWAQQEIAAADEAYAALSHPASG